MRENQARQQMLKDVKPYVVDNDDDEMIMINVKRQKIKCNFKHSEQVTMKIVKSHKIMRTVRDNDITKQTRY